MLNVINHYLSDIKRTEDGFYVGYVDTAEHYKQFLADLKEVGFYFSVRDSEKFKEDGQFLFRCNKSNVPVPFSGSPFRREKNIMYQCAYGSQYYGKIKKNESYESDPVSCEKKQLRIRHSKKLGCKAKMATKCIRIYLEYKISSDNAHWRLKREVISTLKRDLMAEDCKVKSLSRYFVKISEAEQHCHDPIHPKAALKKRLRLAKKNNFLPVEIVNSEECVGENEIHLLEETDVDIHSDISSQALSDMMVKEGANLREQCQKKNKEIMNLSYLCQDEEQLKELLSELTRVTEKLNENVTQSAEAVCLRAEAPEAIVEEICLSNDISHTVVIEKNVCLEIEDPKNVMLEKEICLEIDKNIYFDSENPRALETKKESKRKLHKENEKPYILSIPSKTIKKTGLTSQMKVEKQKKAFSSQTLLEAPNIELLQSNSTDGESVILLIY